jgi:ferredoxin
MLRVLKHLPRPLDYWSTNYYARCETESCTGCGKCVKICPLSALKIHKEDKVSVIDMHRCIGCGVCVPSCPTKARSLVKREKYAVPPDNHDHLLETIMNNKKGKLGKLKVAAKMLLRL